MISNKSQARDLSRIDQVAKVTARVFLADITITSRIERPQVLGKLAVTHRDLAGCRERAPVTAVARRDTRIKHINALTRRAYDLIRQADAHKIPRRSLRQERHHP